MRYSKQPTELFYSLNNIQFTRRITRHNNNFHISCNGYNAILEIQVQMRDSIVNQSGYLITDFFIRNALANYLFKRCTLRKKKTDRNFFKCKLKRRLING